MKADEITIENAKTGIVSAGVTVMHIFCESKHNSHNAKMEISAKNAKLGPKLKKKGLTLIASKRGSAAPKQC
jgi:hypothetical protein